MTVGKVLRSCWCSGRRRWRNDKIVVKIKILAKEEAFLREIEMA